MHRASTVPAGRISVVDPKSLPPLTVGLQDAAKMLGVSDVHLERMVKNGVVPQLRLGHRRLFRLATLDAVLQRLESEATKPVVEPERAGEIPQP